MQSQSITIPLTKGYEAIIDAEDEWLISAYRWHAAIVTNKHIYAMAYAGTSRAERNKSVYLHRIVVGAVRGEVVDHINGNTLDNRKANLRRTNRSGNMLNTRAWREVARLRAILDAHGIPY